MHNTQCTTTLNYHPPTLVTFTLPGVSGHGGDGGGRGACMVFLLFDARLAATPDWVAQSGYVPTAARAVARKRRVNSLAAPTDVSFVAWAKLVQPGNTVRLPGAQSFDENLCSMYRYPLPLPLPLLLPCSTL